MPSRDCFTERIFQIYFLLEEVEEIESPVTTLPGGKRDCQQRHALPLPRVAFASNLPSPPYQSRGTASVSRDKPPTPFCLFLFFLLCGAFDVVALCIPHWRIYRSCVPEREIFPGLHFISGVCACYLGSLTGCDASMRGSAHGIWFEISAVFAAYSALIHGRWHHQGVEYALLLSN